MGLPISRLCRGALLLFSVLVFPSGRVVAQTTNVPARVIQAVDEKILVVLPGNVHSLARPEFDGGILPDAHPIGRMMLLLKRSPEQETALTQLLDDQQNKSSPSYHAWLSPEQFGKQFGPADADIQAVTEWLTSQGFTGIKVGPGRQVVEFSGTAGQVRNAFRAEIRRFVVNGEEYTANANDPQVPAALSPVVAGVVTLHNFPHKSHGRYIGQFRRSLETGETLPLFTFPRPGGNGNIYALGPADFAKIYNVAPLWNATPAVDGTGQTIAIVGETNINIQDVRDFRNIFGLPPNDPEIIVNGSDPGITSKGEESEADLDVQWSGAVAKGAKIRFVVSASTPASFGVDLSALYIVENNLASVMSESYGECEQHMTATESQFYSKIWQQAAAQGITAIVSAGDGGSAGCDNFNLPQPATQGLAVNGFASTPFNIAAGGTDFDQINKWSLYWSATNDPTTQGSALSYIPEIPWNENCSQLGLNGCGPTAPQGSVNIVAGSGGPSTLSASKPLWQMGVKGMPNDNKRDLPDVSLFASAGFTGTSYIICQQDRNLSGHPACDLNVGSGYLDFHGAGGTSAAAPAFAGIMALINQKTGSRQGNANYVLYALAQKLNASCDASLPATVTNTACVFYDITKGNSYSVLAPGVGTNSVPCAGGSPNCSSSTTNGVLVDPQKTTTEAWTAGAGYDLVTGLGSVNAYNLAANWSSVSTIPTTTTLTLSPTTGITHGTGENVTVGITVKANTGTGVPAGDVSLIATFPDGTTQGFDHFTLTSGAVSGGKTQSLPGGAYTVSAHYAGDGANAPSDSSSISVTVGQEGSQTFVVVPQFDPQTGNVISGNASSMVYGSTYIIRTYVANSGATVNPSGPPAPLCADVNQTTCPTGTVTLTDNGTPLDGGTFALNNAGYTRDLHPFLTGGTHQLVARYNGDSSYKPSISTSDTITITPTPSQTQVFVPFLNLVGQSIQFQASVSLPVLSGVAPTGTFTFYDGTTVLPGTATTTAFAGGTFSYPTINGYLTATLNSPGAHNITATYNGDSNYGPSTSPAVSTIAEYQVTISVSADSSTVLYGTPVNLTATITTNHATPVLAGNVTFSAPLNGSVTTSLTTDASGNQVLKATASATPLASQFINAYFSGYPNFADNSAGVSVNVNIPEFTLSIPSAPFNIAAGQPGTLQISLIPATSNSSPVALSFNGSLPIGYTCSLQPSTVNLANGVTSTATLTLSPSPSGTAVMGNGIRSRHTGALLLPSGPNPRWPSSLLSGFSALLALCWAAKRRNFRASLGFGFVCVICLIIGCGGGSYTGPPPPPPPPPGPFATSTTLSTSSAKVAQGAPVSFTAKVTGQGSPSGNVTFYANGGWLGGVTLTAGTATLNTTLPFSGIYTITAQYTGDSNNVMSISSGVGESVTGSTVVQVNGQTSTLFHSANVTVTIQ
jgi:Pro-kumamolisin, activation domain/Bacterial Ig-like domain (group 3)